MLCGETGRVSDTELSSGPSLRDCGFLVCPWLPPRESVADSAPLSEPAVKPLPVLPDRIEAEASLAASPGNTVGGVKVSLTLAASFPDSLKIWSRFSDSC